MVAELRPADQAGDETGGGGKPQAVYLRQKGLTVLHCVTDDNQDYERYINQQVDRREDLEATRTIAIGSKSHGRSTNAQ
ncbi:hypothetical protein D3C87_2094860 [compost metagenome]